MLPSYPFILHPAIIIVECYVAHYFRKHAKRLDPNDEKRMITQLNSLIKIYTMFHVVCTVIVAAFVMNILNKFLAVIGALLCGPLLLLLPSFLHLKVAAESPYERIMNVCILIIGTILILASAVFGIVTIWKP